MNQDKIIVYDIKYHKKVVKFLLKCDIHIAQKFYDNIAILQVDPYSSLLDIKPLKGKQWVWRMRIGKYRFAYIVKEQNVLIYFYDANGRGDIY